MYETYWGLNQSPFTSRCQPEFFFASDIHEEVLARSLYLIEQRRRLGIIRGGSGLGKSMLLHVLAEEMSQTGQKVGVVDASGLNGVGLLTDISIALDLASPVTESEDQLWFALRDHLSGLHFAHQPVLLCVDHIERLEAGALRILERIAGDQLHRENSLSMIATLRDDADRETDRPASASRILRVPQLFDELTELRVELQPLTRSEIHSYVHARIFVAGGALSIFSDEALDQVFDLSQGVPRQINRLCDIALLAGMSERTRRIDSEMVIAAARELRIPVNTSLTPSRVPSLL